MHRIFVSAFGVLFSICFIWGTPTQVAASEPELIRIGTLNANLMPSPLKFKADRYVTPYKDRLAGFGRVTKMGWFDGDAAHLGLDIIGYQEVWRQLAVGDTHYTALRKQLEANGFERRNILRGTGKGFERGWHHGLVIASRYPIEDRAEMTFFHKAGDDFFGEKGVLFARINVNGTRIAVFNTHLQADTTTVFYPKVREKQLRQMRKFLSKHAKPGEPIFVMGDINIDRGGPCPDRSVYCGWMRGEQGGNWNAFTDNIPKAGIHGLDYIISAAPGPSRITGQTYEHWVYVDANGNPELVGGTKKTAPASTPERQKITDHPLVYGAFQVSK